MIEGTTRPVIVGIDPGTTSAAVVLDLNGDLIGHKSTKNFSKNQIIEFIIGHGKPLLMGTDVSRTPSLIKDVSSNMGAIRCIPDDDLQSSYKEELAATVGLDDADTHTMDAAAAAVYAYREHADKLDAIRHRATQKGLAAAEVEEAAELVLRQGVSTSDAITTVDDRAREPDDTDGTDWKQIAAQRQQEIDTLRGKVEQLSTQVRQLQQAADRDETEDRKLAATEEELRDRNRRIARLRDRVEEKDALINRLQDENRALSTAVDLFRAESGAFIPVVDDLARAGSDIVYTETYRGGAVADRVDTVLTKESLVNTPPYKSLREQGVHVVALESLDTTAALEDGYVIDAGALQDAAETGETFTQWLEAYKKRQVQ